MPDLGQADRAYSWFFSDAILKIPSLEGGITEFKVVYAVQNPQYLALAPLEQVASASWTGEGHQRRWSCNLAAHGSATDLPDLKLHQVWYHGCAEYEGGIMISSSEPAVPVSVMVAGDASQAVAVQEDGDDVSVKKVGRDPKGDTYVDELLKEYPWLQHLEQKLTMWASTDKETGSSGHRAQHGGPELDVPDEAEMFSALADLEKERDIAEEEGALLQPDFATRVRGRVAATAKEAAGPMGLQGQCRTELGRDFCKRRGLHSTFKCTYRTHLRGPSGVLCRAWCDKMQHFLHLEADSEEGEAFVFEDTDCRAYKETTELQALAAGELPAATRERIAFIRNIPTRLIA